MPKLGRIVRTAMAIIGGVIVVAVLVYEVVLPEYYARAYIAKIQSLADSELNVFVQLSKTTERDILYDSSVSNSARIGDVTAMQQAVDTARLSIDELEEASSALPTVKYSGYTPSYRDAQLLQSRVRAFVEQGRVTIAQYQDLVNRVSNYDILIADAKRDIEDFNQITDINSYAGRSADVRLIEIRLRGLADTIANTQAPEDYQAYQKSASDAILRASEGFGNLAYGLDIAVDSVIYQAVTDIERAGNDLDQIDLNATNQIDKSRILKDVRDLSEKMELFTQ